MSKATSILSLQKHTEILPVDYLAVQQAPIDAEGSDIVTMLHADGMLMML